MSASLFRSLDDIDAALAKIHDVVPASATKGFKRLEYMCNTFGPRLSGSVALVEATNWCASVMREDGFHVVLQPCNIPNWKRHFEHAAFYRRAPVFDKDNKKDGDDNTSSKSDKEENQHSHSHSHSHSTQSSSSSSSSIFSSCSVNVFDRDKFRLMQILAVGSSHSTPQNGLDLPVVVVSSFDHCHQLGAQGLLNNTCVLFNIPFTPGSYGNISCYRSTGGQHAQKYGAKAAIIRSIGPVGFANPHTGTSSDECSIPVACCTAEDAMLAQVLTEASPLSLSSSSSSSSSSPSAVPLPLYVHLCISTSGHGSQVVGHNIIFDLPGIDEKLKDEIIIIGGHIDSWDVGHGAHDDAQGCFVAWEAIRLLQELGLRTRRTLRCVFFVDEEQKSSGAKAYSLSHPDVSNIVAAIESDMGCYTAVGFGVSCHPSSFVTLQSLIKKLEAHNIGKGVCDQDTQPKGRGVDICPLIDRGVPGLLLKLDDEWSRLGYFRYHHTEADTVDKISLDHFKQNVQVMAATLYLLGMMNDSLKHHEPGSV